MCAQRAVIGRLVGAAYGRRSLVGVLRRCVRIFLCSPYVQKHLLAFVLRCQWIHSIRLRGYVSNNKFIQCYHSCHERRSAYNVSVAPICPSMFAGLARGCAFVEATHPERKQKICSASHVYALILRFADYSAWSIYMRQRLTKRLRLSTNKTCHCSI